MKFLIAILLLGSCASYSPIPEEVPEAPVVNPIKLPGEDVPPKDIVEEEGCSTTNSAPVGNEFPVPSAKKVFTVKIVDLNYTAEQKAKLADAAKYIALIMNSQEFKKAILEREKFTNTLGLTNAKIYDKLFKGAEALSPAENYQMDLKVKMYYSRRRTVGYTYETSLIVYTNSKFHSWYTACEVASNAVHEWSHKLGFMHSSASDSESVPYSLNDVVENLCPLAMAGKLKAL